MKAICLTVLLAAVFAAVIGQQAPSDCNLRVRNFTNVNSATTGENLRYCARPERQCCTDGYFTERIRYLRASLLSGLREQISSNGDILNGIHNGLNEYIYSTFIPRFLTNLELPINLNQNISTFNTTIRNNIFIRPRHSEEDNFTVGGFTEGFFMSQVELLIHSIIEPLIPRNNGSGMSGLTTEQLVCARTNLRGIVNETTKNRIDRSVQQLRLALTAVSRIRTWFDLTFLPNISRYFNPINACLEGFIRLRCQDCVANISRTCRGVCNAITYGCYAVVQNGLSGQFNTLWNVTDQLVRISREAVRNVSHVLPRHLLRVNLNSAADILGVVRGLGRDCSIQVNLSLASALPTPRRYNDSDVMVEVPVRVVNNATNLLRTGLVRYGNNGAAFCREETNTNCWNGTMEVPNYVPNFTSTTIAGQANNPYVNVSVTELRNEVNRIGNPVTDYLSEASFLEVAPQELVIPEDEPYTGGASSLMMSAFLMVIMTIFYAVFV